MKSIDKGKRAEREFCRLMNDWAGERVFERNSHGRSQHHADIITPDWFPIKTIEVRWREKWKWLQVLAGYGPIWQWQKEVAAAAALYWLAFTQNRAPWFILCNHPSYAVLTEVVGEFSAWRSRDDVLFPLKNFLEVADAQSFR